MSSQDSSFPDSEESTVSVQGRCGAFVLLGLLTTASMAQAQEFTGTYMIGGDVGAIILSLEQDDAQH